MAKFAKFHRAGEPAMRRMLVEGRQQALEKALALLEARLRQASDPDLRQRLAQKIEEVREQRARVGRLARRVPPHPQENIPPARQSLHPPDTGGADTFGLGVPGALPSAGGLGPALSSPAADEGVSPIPSFPPSPTPRRGG